MPGRIVGGDTAGWDSQSTANALRNLVERNALVRDAMQSRTGGCRVDGEPVQPGCVERMHGGPTVESVADIGGDAVLACHPNQRRHEAVAIEHAVHGR